MHNKISVYIIVVTMLLGIILVPTSPAQAQDHGVNPGDGNRDERAQTWQPLAPAQQQKPRVIGETDHTGTEPARYTVLLESPPLALYRGDTGGLAATNPHATGAKRLAVETEAAAAYTQHLERQQATTLDAIATTIGRTPAVIFDYRVTLNGFTLEMTPQEAQAIVAMQGVKSVQRDGHYELHTDAGPAWIGAPAIWDGSALPGSLGNRGEGVVIGVLDTGINQHSPSFAATSGDGYINANPRDKYYGVCDPEGAAYVEAFTCNEKLIGGWDFVDSGTGPVDYHGHGSHTASTAGGNRVPDAVANSPIYQYGAPISGVAPRASIIAYKVCASYGCPFSSIQAGIEQATIDQVDVINFSIGGYPEDPWADTMAMAFLAASEAGVTVVTSAGNDGPDASTVGSPANAPWVISVGASSHNRRTASNLTDISGGDTPPPGDIPGKGLSHGYGPAPVVYAGYYGNPSCNSYDFAENTFDGEIVLCDWNGGSRVSKGENVKAAGGGGVILTNSVYYRASTVVGPHPIPAMHITYLDGLRLKLWLATGADHTATISPTTIDLAADNGDIMAFFSSRGPNPPLPDVLKPDLTAPGVDIFAAYTESVGYAFSNGTSMSSPHVAGAVALVRAAYPDWTPAEIKAALMLTADAQGVRKEDNTSSSDPFDRGAGRVDLRATGRAGFVLDESSTNFEEADPSVGGDSTALNLASLSNRDCVAACSWVRRLKSTQDSPVTWTFDGESSDGLEFTVEPPSFTLAAGGEQTITITAHASAESVGLWAFGQVNLTPDNSALATAHFPVAIYASAGNLADINLQTRRNQGRYTVNDIVTISMDDLVTTIYADVSATAQVEIGYDPSTYSPYSDLNSVGVTWTLQTLTDTTKIFRVSTSDSTASDLDLYVGYDANGDGQPSPEEELCVPFTYSADEVCEFVAPLEAGDYWVMVYNYASYSNFELDTFLLSTLIVDERDTENITASGPAKVVGGEPFDLAINWDIPEMTVGEVYAGVVEMGNKRADSNDLTVVLGAGLTLTRQADDVQFSSTETAIWPGRLLTYSFDVVAERTTPGASTNYTFVATLPAGLTYVPDSASMTPTSITANTIRWEDVEVIKQAYTMTDSISDAQCDTSEGGYIDLEDYYILPRATIVGDDFIYDIDAFYGAQDPFDFFGADYPAFYVTANGFGGFDRDIGDSSGINTDLPDPARPNSLIAPFWRDLEVVYEVVREDYYGSLLSVRGISIAGKGYGEEMIIEFDDVEPAPAGSTDARYDFEIVVRRQVDDTPGVHEIVLAYGDLDGPLTPATIGIENADGSVAHKYAYNDAELADGLMICYDSTAPVTTITFQATVDETSAARLVDTMPVVTTLDHSVNMAGYASARAEVVQVLYTTPLDQLLLPLIIGGE